MTDINTLAAERDRLTAEIEGMDLDPQAAKAVAEAERAIALHDAKVAALRAKRDSLDERFGITKQREAEARRQANIERRDAQCRDLIAHEEYRLAHIEQAQAHLELMVTELSAAFAHHTKMREIANALTAGAKLHSLGALSPTEFENRAGVWLAGCLQLVSSLPGKLKGRVGNIGSLLLPTSPHYKPDLGWRTVEEQAVASGIEAVIAYAQGELE